MPLDPELWPYVVLGNGIKPDDVDFVDIVQRFGTGISPVYHYATTLETAHKLAKQLELWHDTVLICKIEEVVR